ncbi:class I SAM-dependent methyltransferase [Chloroflexota bacterium]
MNLPEYEYKGLMALAWDVLRGDTSGWEDRPFYLGIIQKYGQPVLDIGCGTGRLLLDYLKQGIDIDGVDNSPEMLEICRQKAAEMSLSPVLYEQYMEELDLPRRYRTILIPSSSLQLIIESRAVNQALSRIYDQLLPGGIVAASIMALWKEGAPLENDWEHTATRAEDGVKFRRESKSRYDSETEFEHTEDLYQMIEEDKVVQEEMHKRSPATRSYTQTQAKKLFEQNGFENITLLRAFSNEPVKHNDDVFVIIGQK